MKNFFKFKIVSSPLCSFCNLEDKTPTRLFYSCNHTKSLWSKFQELLNSNTTSAKSTTECFVWFSRS